MEAWGGEKYNIGPREMWKFKEISEFEWGACHRFFKIFFGAIRPLAEIHGDLKRA